MPSGLDKLPRIVKLLVVFVSAVATDTALSWWTLDVQQGRRVEASLCSGLIGIISMIGTHTIISKDKLLICAWIAGLCVGTYAAMSV